VSNKPPELTIVLPDAGPLITLAYADALDLLLKPGWPVHLVDMVLHEVTRHQTPTSQKIAQWVAAHSVALISTRTYSHHQQLQATTPLSPTPRARQPNLGELAIQEAMHTLALTEPHTTAVFLFEDHKIARASFLVPDNCRKVSTRAWLQFLEVQGLIESANAIERAAIAKGRNFSTLRFPLG
jgi:hypothetical protein